jgi:hypothetical protein
MSTPKIPHIDSIAELARFWDTHDLTDFEDELNYSHLKWEFVWEPLEAVRVISYLSNRSSKRWSSFS